MYILNSFSLNMLQDIGLTHVEFSELPLNMVRAIVKNSKIKSGLGHADTAQLFSKLLDTPLEENRVTIKLEKGQVFLVGQYSGTRLATGQTELPEGAEIKWVMGQVL